MIYKKIIKPILFLMQPETAHNFTIFTQSLLSKTRLKGLIEPFFNYNDKILETEEFVIKFKNPIGLPAGCDKGAKAIDVWEVYGFGFATAGSVVFNKQPGNPKPRLFRLKEDLSFQVNLGLNSDGAEKFFSEFKKRKKLSKIPLGISIARSTHIKEEEVIDDYIKSFKLLYDLPDYFEINISCPNIENVCFFNMKTLPLLLERIQENNRLKKPILIKIGPDLDENELDNIIKNVIDYRVDGVVATNLIKDLTKIKAKNIYKGGISGKLLEKYANKTISYLYKNSNNKFKIIGLGGIFNGNDAYEKIKLGASLVQVYTGMVFEGPGLIRKILKELALLLKRDKLDIKSACGVYYR